MSDESPKPEQTVKVVAVSTPVRHDGLLHEIGKPFVALWRDVEHLVSAGIAKLEGIVKPDPKSTPSKG